MKAVSKHLEWKLTTAEGHFGGENRSPGVHLSDILNRMEANLGIERKGGGGGEQYMLMGFLWEMIFSEALERYFGMQRPLVTKQNETRVDGIYLTPDALSTDGFLEEYKVTWKSKKKMDNFEVNFWRWLVQIKANCYAAGTNKARLIVFWVNGYYQPPTPCFDGNPMLMEFEFTDEELKSNWQMCVAVRDQVANTPAAIQKPEAPKPEPRPEKQEEDDGRGVLPRVRRGAGSGRRGQHRRV